MNSTQLFIPMFIQILLTFILLQRMGFLRFQSLRQKKVQIKDIALGQNAWPESLTKATNSFHNQMEMPILFYAAILTASIYQNNSVVFLILAWVFAITRIFHALVHITTNNVRFRFSFFLAGVISLLLMWINLAIHIL